MADAAQPTLPFDTCARKHGGNPNSVRAFEQASESFSAMRERIRVYVSGRGFKGATPKEVAAAFGKELHTISGRFKRLRDENFIFDSGRTRENSTVYVTDRRHVNGSERTA